MIDLGTRCSICDEPLEDVGDICETCGRAINAAEEEAREEAKEREEATDD